MSKKSKNAASEKRKKEKAARKAAMKAQYAAWAAAGSNRKKKITGHAARKTIRSVSHLTGPCGNAACRKCTPLARDLASRIYRSPVGAKARRTMKWDRAHLGLDIRKSEIH